MLILVGCGTRAASGDPLTIRTPHPTFTPTPQPAQLQAAVTPETAIGGAVAAPTGANAAGNASPTGARAVVNSPLVNARTGPSTDFDIVATVERGDEYDIVGKNSDGSWWQVCCIAGADAWIIAEYVDTDGPVDSVPVAGQQPSAEPAATAEPPTTGGATTTADAMTFDLRKQEQFPETGLVRIFLYVVSGTDSQAGYSLRITHNGAELPVEGESFAGQPAFTWPFQDARQRYQNFKIEFADIDPAGVWEVQLIDSSGSPAGPAATFNLAANDPQQELYVRYEKR